MTNKDTQGKAPLHLTDPDFEQECCWVKHLGNEKYGYEDWKRGMPWSYLVAATQRHLNAIKRGEFFDVGPGGDHRSHMAHISTNMEMLAYYNRNLAYEDLNDLQQFVAVDGKAKAQHDLPPLSERASVDRMEALQARIATWANNNPALRDRTPEDALRKLVMEEIPELLTSEKSSDPTEWADCFILILDIFYLLNIDPIEHSHAKMDTNEKREWAVDPKTGLVGHVESRYEGDEDDGHPD